METLSSILINVLRTDALRHDRGDFANLGSKFDEIELYRSRHPDLETSRSISIALTFWDAWIDQVRHGFVQNFYKGIQPADWPRMATDIANHLETDTDITDPSVVGHFDLARRKTV